MNIAIDTSVVLSENGLTVQLASGRTGYFNAYWLRDNCPTSFDSQTRERTFDIFHLDAAPKAQSTELTADGLTVVWNDGHRSTYPMDFLERYAKGERRQDPANLPRRAWFSDHYANIAKFSQPKLLADKAEVARWIEALLVEGVAIVTDVPDSDEGLTETVRLIGHVRPTFFGEFFDVRTHIKPTNLAYTAKALEMHTDTPAEDLAPGMQFLHCRANSVEGGRNLFLDGVAVANDLRKEDPEAFRLLSETHIPYYCEHDHYDVRSLQRVIELDEYGAVTGVTISQHMADIFDLPQQFLDAYYPAFCKFGRMLQSDKYMMRFRLNATECIVFDNHRIVHGRAAYSATSGERYLRGCYSDRGEMRSTYRAMVSESRFK
ncbi:MAG: taurine catabolism dioxygenase TauD, TfdA family protein [Cypionkella sp.]|uniref:TauD/TfdA family dioxygenase n=1 Tax=Cypionkella sp. TaxID=2811411 RepID=UPI00260495EB|nr:TauD/TfdA family dioxygenase [Cypionkella sp.]MDB5659896.1 taurine catabolism dioxygenase TauD, TfdA family protein [Cypionkella sp.]